MPLPLPKRLLAAWLLMAMGPAWAAAPTRTYTYTTGQTIDPSQVTTNEDNLFAYTQAGVDTYAAGSIAAAALADNAVTSAKILNGTITPADLSGSPVDDAVYVADSASAATWRTITNCADSGGNHLNYTQATNTFSCGTSSASTTGFKVVEFTRDTSVASGTQTVAGVGFTPKAVIFISAQNGAAGEMSIGFDDGTTASAIRDENLNVTDTWGAGITVSIADLESGVNSYNGKISSFNADGAVVTWTRNGTPTGTITIDAIFLR